MKRFPIDYLLVILIVVCISGLGFSGKAYGNVAESAREQLIQVYGGVYQLSLHDHLWLEEIFQRLVTSLQTSNATYSLTVLNSSEINAFALPDGQIFVTIGLLRLFNRDEHRTAAVLGHEIAHVEKGHGMQALWRKIGLTVLMELGIYWLDARSSEAARVTSSALVEIVQSGYSREAEFEADLFGQQYAMRAGFDPVGAVNMLADVMMFESEELPMKIFRTHPDTKERMERMLAQAYTFWGVPVLVTDGPIHCEEERQNRGLDPLGRFQLYSEQQADGSWTLQGTDHQTGDAISWLPDLRVKDPAWSKNGRLLAVSVQKLEYWEIWILNRLGNVVSRWAADDQADLLHPIFSPTGDKIAYTKKTALGSQVWVGCTEEVSRIWIARELNGSVLWWDKEGLVIQAVDSPAMYQVEPPRVQAVAFANPVPRIVERKKRIAPMILRESDSSITLRRPNILTPAP